MHYPSRTPVEKANLDAFLADSIARRYPDGTPRHETGKTNLRITKLSAREQARVVERMADDMFRHGDGMTRNDLRMAGYPDQVIDICADKARAKASERANFN